MTRKFVLTGGPGGGKSCIILALEQMGEYVVREAAEDCIRYRQALGQPEPWRDPGFQGQILRLQLQREEIVPSQADRVFIDRGLADGLAYAEPGSEIYNQTRRNAQESQYDLIFLVEPLPWTEKSVVRRESREEALALGKRLRDIYTSLGYTVITIPAESLDKRTQNVLVHADSTSDLEHLTSE